MGIMLASSFVIFLLIGVPIVWILSIVPTVWIFFEGIDLSIVASRLQVGVNSFVLMAIPFFIMAGDLMGKVGITERLINLVNLIFGRLRGGLAHVCIYTELIFSGITGSAVADVSALGKIFIPAMEKQGYKKSWALANLCNATVVGPIIPPSILIVLYGAATGTSVGAMMVGALIPGLVIGVGQSIYVAFIAKRRNFPKIKVDITPKKLVKTTFAATPALLMPLIIIFGIYTGIVTPTESAAVAVIYAMILGFFGYKTLKIKDLIEIGKSTARESAMCLFVTGISGLLGWITARTGAATLITTTLLGITTNPVLMFLIVIGILLVMGALMDEGPVVILAAPIIAPMMEQLGFDPVHFGVVFIAATSIGLVNPPVGIVLFAASGAHNMKLEEIIKEIYPFVILDIFLILLLALVPELTLWLPRLGGLL